MSTPLLELTDFFTSFSGIINSLTDAIENKTHVDVSKQARGALFLAIVFYLIYAYPNAFSLFLSGSSAQLGALILAGLAVIDILVRTIRPRRLRTHEKLQEIASGITEGNYAPQDAATYLSDLSFTSDPLDPLLQNFQKLPPTVQKSLVENQVLTNKQLENLTSSNLDPFVLRELIEGYPQAFSRQLIDKWVRQFRNDSDLILAIAKYQLVDPSSWETYIKDDIVGSETSKSLRVELTYNQNPSRLASFLKTHSNPVSTVVVGPIFLAIAAMLIILVDWRMVQQLSWYLNMTLVASLVIVFYMMIWASALSGMSKLLSALGNWIDRRAKGKLRSSMPP